MAKSLGGNEQPARETAICRDHKAAEQHNAKSSRLNFMAAQSALGTDNSTVQRRTKCGL